MKTKSTRIGKNIFEDTTSTTPAPRGPGLSAAPQPIAARTAAEDKTTVILPPDQVAFLDQLALTIRATTGWKVRRTEIIRALVGSLMQADIDLTSSRSEADITAAVAERIKG